MSKGQSDLASDSFGQRCLCGYLKLRWTKICPKTRSEALRGVKFISFSYFYVVMQQLDLFEQLKLLQEDPKPIEVDTRSLTKVYYTITEVADMFQVNASLLRFWEKEFPVQLAHIKKNKKGDRFYTKKDIEKLKMLFHLVKEKRMTLEGARAHLKDQKKKAKDEYNLIENLEKVRSFLIDLKKSISTE